MLDKSHLAPAGLDTMGSQDGAEDGSGGSGNGAEALKGGRWGAAPASDALKAWRAATREVASLPFHNGICHCRQLSSLNTSTSSVSLLPELLATWATCARFGCLAQGTEQRRRCKCHDHAA
jgi:hypothetical protein